jgi:pyruvate/2-oxoglutarate dehydrogenase complex dihydrolipoamide dehydrogenase (E3) component
VRTAEVATPQERNIEADICVIGAGSAGLTVAAGAVQMGARTVLIESGRMGGDCLNTGCVPSKSLIAAAAVANTARKAAAFGVLAAEPKIDFARVHDHLHEVIGAIAPHDSEERFTKLGCTVIRAKARFLDARAVEAGGRVIRARRFVIATGSRAAVPPIPGLDRVPYFTNETLFESKDLPKHLIVIGAGPFGIEMAQAYRRLGARVTVLDLGPMLPRDDPEAVAVLRDTLRGEGIEIVEQMTISGIARSGNDIAVALADRAKRIEGSHLLVATGRRPNVEDLGLEAAGVRYTSKGIAVDLRLRTGNRRIYAIGDVVGSYQFTHVAGYHAGVVLQNALFRLPTKIDFASLPWVTYSDPELAQVGMTEGQARPADGRSVTVLRGSLADNDRAQAQRTTTGFIKVNVGKHGRVLGATILAHNAGELLLPWVLAISQGIKIGALARLIAPYPTISEITKRVAGSYYAPVLFGARTRWFVRILGWLG